MRTCEKGGMDDDRPLSERRRAALLRLGAWLLLAVSPLGAPAIGLLLAWGCDISWDDSTQCVVPEPVITYFLTIMLIAMAAGGLPFAILWLLAAAGTLFGCLVQAARALWLFLVEREDAEDEMRVP